MIILLNGSFGVGKSSVATALCSSLAQSMIYDPEAVGSVLRYLTEGIRGPEEDTDDFQDIALWPELTVLLADRLYRQYRRHLIIPMTIAHPRYLDTICTGLASITPPLYQFCLLASLETIERRLQGRDAHTTWAIGKARQYVPLFGDPRYGIPISTENRSVQEIAAQIQQYIAHNSPS